LHVAAARLYAARVRLEDLRRTLVPDLHRLYVEEERDLPSGGLSALKEDPRAGARAVAEKIEKRNHEAQAEGRRLSRLCAFELPLWEQGIILVGGCDEVGMAPLAGPVIAAAVILRPGTRIKGVNDSKLLTPEERDALEPEIRAQAVAVGIGRAEVTEIDSYNIYRAGLMALKRAVLALDPQPQHLLIDARRLDGMAMPQQPIIKGDAKSITIGAASIVAKVFRDRLMAQLDCEYPGYGFRDHKGYPTPDHLDALERLGACPLHRRSFAPVAKKLGLIPEQQELFAAPKKRAGEAR
jgi:ribonuclease HII